MRERSSAMISMDLRFREKVKTHRKFSTEIKRPRKFSTVQTQCLDPKITAAQEYLYNLDVKCRLMKTVF